MSHERRGLEFWILTVFFVLFVLFLYGPLSAILILSFQGPSGGLTFPLNGVSLHWFYDLTQQQAVGDFGGSFRRSLMLGIGVMLVTVVVLHGMSLFVLPSLASMYESMGIAMPTSRRILMAAGRASASHGPGVLA